MTMRWRKVVGDLRAHRAQFGAVLAVLVLGIAGVIGALDARAILEREIAVTFESARVPDLALWLERVEPAQLARVAGEEGVVGVDARRVINTRVRAADGSWLPMRLTILDKVPPSTLGRLHDHENVRGAAESAIFIEQSGDGIVDARVSRTVKTRRTGGEQASLPFGGFVHDPAVAPSTQERIIYAFGTPATAERLGYGRELDQLLVKMEYRGLSGDAVAFATRLADKLAQSGPRPIRIELLPATHPHAGLMTAMLRILGVVAALAFVASAALTGYLVSAWMRREVRAVGIMKTLGARSWQVAAQYLALVLPLVATALAIAFPLGKILGRMFAGYEALVVNIDVASWSIPTSLLALELALAIAIPLFAMALPLVRAARMTPRSAIQDPGIAPPRIMARAAARVLALPNLGWTLALRNVFRRPGRALLMLLALGSGGAVLVMSLTNYKSLVAAMDRTLAQQAHDVEVYLQRPATSAELEAIAANVREVEIAEAWRRAGVSIGPASADARFVLVGYPEATRLFRLPIVEGARPKAPNEVLVTKALLDLQPALAPGKTVEVAFRERKAAVRISGFVEQIGTPAMYAPFAAFDAVTGLGDSAFAVRVKGNTSDLDLLADRLDQAFLDQGRAPAQMTSKKILRDALIEHIEVVGGVMRTAAFAVALVGAIVLVATVIFNVAERRREVGILRAIGATPERIRAIFMVEAVSIMLAACGLATAGGLLLSRAMLNLAERTLLRVTVPTEFSLAAFGILVLGLLLVLAAIRAALGHALRAPAREALAAD